MLGELCYPCHEMLLTGNVHPKNITFIGDLNRKAAIVDELKARVDTVVNKLCDVPWPR